MLARVPAPKLGTILEQILQSGHVWMLPFANIVYVITTLDTNRLIHAVCLLTSTCLLAKYVVTSTLLIQGLDPGFLFLLLALPVLFHAAGSLPQAHLSHSACYITLLGAVGVGTGAVMTAVIMKHVPSIRPELALELPVRHHCCCH